MSDFYVAAEGSRPAELGLHQADIEEEIVKEREIVEKCASLLCAWVLTGQLPALILLLSLSHTLPGDNCCWSCRCHDLHPCLLGAKQRHA